MKNERNFLLICYILEVNLKFQYHQHLFRFLPTPKSYPKRNKTGNLVLMTGGLIFTLGTSKNHQKNVLPDFVLACCTKTKTKTETEIEIVTFTSLLETVKNH